MKSTNVRWQRTPIRGEATWIPRTLDDLADLRRRLTAAGHTSTVVNGIGAWLTAKAIGETDRSSSATRARYRRILAELGPGPYPENDRTKVRDAGDVDRGTLVGTGLVGAAGMAMAMGQPLVAVGAALIFTAHNARYVKFSCPQSGRAAASSHVSASRRSCSLSDSPRSRSTSSTAASRT